MKIFAFGDIHGNYEDFINLLNTLPINLNKDHLVLLGDLVDSGPQVRNLLNWCILFERDHPDTFHPLRGNHEDLLLDSVANSGLRVYDDGLWMEQGGRETLKSYPDSKISLEHI